MQIVEDEAVHNLDVADKLRLRNAELEVEVITLREKLGRLRLENQVLKRNNDDLLALQVPQAAREERRPLDIQKHLSFLQAVAVWITYMITKSAKR